MLTVALLGLSPVLIDHDTEVVGIAFAGVPYIGARILEHRDEERQHITVGVHVLDGLHQARALPLPAVQLGLEVPAVAGPHRHDVAVKAVLVVTVGIHLADESLVATLVGRFIVGKILVDVIAHDGDEHGAVTESGAQSITDLVAHLLNTRLGKRHVAEVLTHVHLHGVILDVHRPHFQVSHTHVFGQFAGYHALHGIQLFLGELLPCR